MWTTGDCETSSFHVETGRASGVRTPSPEIGRAVLWPECQRFWRERARRPQHRRRWRVRGAAASRMRCDDPMAREVHMCATEACTPAGRDWRDPEERDLRVIK